MGRAEAAELVESGSNHMGQEPVGVPLVELLPMYLELRAGNEIGASGGGPEQGGRMKGVLLAQPGFEPSIPEKVRPSRCFSLPPNTLTLCRATFSISLAPSTATELPSTT
ncbi:hypothetical protein FJTKL_00679 [Diaporthe vaccinii]|uniref:Uncharacterized protein n=1 Tax=Diaporthe vaccinii TaxID=105482 RepID=A0ABR4F688_9PEZI